MVCKGHQQEFDPLGTAHNLPAKLTPLNPIQLTDRQGVAEHQHCGLECNSVFEPVASALDLVPLELHQKPSTCTYKFVCIVPKEGDRCQVAPCGASKPWGQLREFPQQAALVLNRSGHSSQLRVFVLTSYSD